MWQEIKDFAGILGIISVVILLALTERFRRVFAAVSDHKRLDERVTKLEATQLAMSQQVEQTVRRVVKEAERAITRDIDGLGQRLDRYEKLTIGNTDQIADLHGRANVQATELRTLQTHGGPPVQALTETIHQLHRKLDRLSVHLQHITGIADEGE